MMRGGVYRNRKRVQLVSIRAQLEFYLYRIEPALTQFTLDSARNRKAATWIPA